MTPSQPSIVSTTDCNPRMTATTSPQPTGTAGKLAVGAGGGAPGGPPSAKHAMSKIKNATVFITAVSICAPLPQRIPRHCKMPNPTMTETAISFTCPAKTGKRSPLYSAITMPTAAAVPHVESQSLHPTMKPAYSPMARREKLYCPPLRGMAAPSSASEDAPNNAYSPPTTQTPMNNQAFGKTWAMSPGVRTIPAAIALPMAAETPNQTPRTCSSRPRFRGGVGVSAATPEEDPSNELDNLESQVSQRNSAIIMAARQNASWNSPKRKIALIVPSSNHGLQSICTRSELLIWWRSVRLEFGVVGVGLDQPDLAVSKISKQFCVLLRVELASPQHFCAIDVRAIEDPLVMDIVIVGVAHDDQMFPRRMQQLFHHRHTARISRTGPPERITSAAKNIEASAQHQHHQQHAGQLCAHRPRFPLHQAQVAHRLNQQRVDDTCQRRRIMRSGPDHGEDAVHSQK